MGLHGLLLAQKKKKDWHSANAQQHLNTARMWDKWLIWMYERWYWRWRVNKSTLGLKDRGAPSVRCLSSCATICVLLQSLCCCWTLLRCVGEILWGQNTREDAVGLWSELGFVHYFRRDWPTGRRPMFVLQPSMRHLVCRLRQVVDEMWLLNVGRRQRWRRFLEAFLGWAGACAAHRAWLGLLGQR